MFMRPCASKHNAQQKLPDPKADKLLELACNGRADALIPPSLRRHSLFC
jgi:predicted nucleic acid-binding protein